MTDKTSELTSQIVTAFVANHAVAVADLPGLIQTVHRSLTGAGAEPEVEKMLPKAPAVPIRRSITPDYLVCLEDGKMYKSLKRHLLSEHGMDAAAYRAKWGLPTNYPMAAPNYSEKRSNMAKAIGLGGGVRRGASADAAPAANPLAPSEAINAPVKRTRRSKAPKPPA